MKKLTLSLVEAQLRIRAQITSLPVETKSLLQKYSPQEEPESGTSKAPKRRRCQLCYQHNKKTSFTAYGCQKCNIALCLKQHSKIVCENCLDANEED